MCGINGIVRLSAQAPAIDLEELVRTRDAMALRGPDGVGVWISPSGRAALGHRRLAILDLSPTGSQPMASPHGHHLILNGEVYNFRELRRELERDGVAFRSTSDTEVILALYAREGAAMLRRLRGMFALALWDEPAGRLLLARDPLGIKPLYYAIDGGVLRFASQVKALEASGAVSMNVDPAGLAGFLLWGAVPEPLTIRRAVKALPAGHLLDIATESDAVPVPRRWSAPPEPETLDPLHPVMAVEDSVRAHLVSDVPVAVFLSAGLDSGLVAALARRHLPEPPTTFTLRFEALEGTPADEAPLAAEVARALGTRHVERRLGAADLAGLWPRVLAAMDQPSIDGANTFAVCRAAHEAGIKVALSGLGGDEVFGSYPSFRDVPRAARLAARARRVPGLPALWPAAARLAAAGRPKLAGLLAHGATLPGAYLLRRGLFLPQELPALLGPELAAEGLAAYDPLADAVRALDGHGADPWLAVHAMETGIYLKNQLLRDADWAAMAWSVELRVPFVDPWLAAHLGAAGFEPARSQGKAALVRRAAPELPAALFERPKTGFYVPIAEALDPELARARPGERSRRLALRLLAEMGLASPPPPADGLDVPSVPGSPLPGVREGGWERGRG